MNLIEPLSQEPDSEALSEEERSLASFCETTIDTSFRARGFIDVKDSYPACDHVAGEFLGQGLSKHTDRYRCIKCKCEFTKKWYY
jgi:hypothetical protein